MQFRKIEPFPGVAPCDWQSWKWQFKNALKTAIDYQKYFDLDEDEQLGFREGAALFQIRTTPYYAGLADRKDPRDPVRRMLMPHGDELKSGGQQMADPLGEGLHSPVERIIHRYPDRVLFLVTDQCSVYCRYCLRKHFTAHDQAVVKSDPYEIALDYVRSNPGIREVILSGGDPLTLTNSRLDKVLFDLRSIDHVEIIRIGTRMPVVCPMRVDEDLAKLFRKHKPVYLLTHFNHPKELSEDSAHALECLVDHGVPAFNQMVLLRGINNHPAIVQALSRRLMYLRVKPYYMFQCDPSEGTDHFRTSVEESKAIQRELWGRLSGLAMPNLSLDIPGGGGKVGFTPEFLEDERDGRYQFKGWDGRQGEYVDPANTPTLPSDIGDYLEEWERLKKQRYGRLV